MKSPFPGMDPFLEHPAFWSDFQFTFINYWREAVADTLPPHYEATLGERVYLVEHDPEMRKLGFSDVVVTHDDLSSSTPPGFSSWNSHVGAGDHSASHFGRTARNLHFLVSHGERRPDCEVYRWALRDPLPTLPIPLRAPDPDIFVDLARYSPPRMLADGSSGGSTTRGRYLRL